MCTRNKKFLPIMGDEGIFVSYVPIPPIAPEGQLWYQHLTPNHRLFYHQTLNGVRKMKAFRQTHLVPKDGLDFLMASRYDQSVEVFADRADILMQPETAGKKTFRKLRNSRDLPFIEEEHLGHPLKIGGTTDRVSPHSVKLMNSGHHTQMTNNGYSRQSGDGNFFKY